MTKKQAKRFREIDNGSLINEQDRKLFPGIHFCPEWDYLLIWDGLTNEMACCICFSHSS